MIILQDIGTRNGKMWSIVKCEDCGIEYEKRKDGCKENSRCRSCSLSTHKLTNSKLFVVHRNMKSRCYSESHKSYKRYGYRGISICDEWRYDFKAFYEWAINNGYKEGLTIDRINNDGNYEPNNCRWASANVQQRNTKKLYKSNTTGYRGVGLKNNRFTARLKVNGKTVWIGTYDTATESACAYDMYVIKNNLEHTLNFKPKDYIDVYLKRTA